jgi:hypothetical protein
MVDGGNIDGAPCTWLKLDTGHTAGYHVREPYGAMVTLLLNQRSALGWE